LDTLGSVVSIGRQLRTYGLGTIARPASYIPSITSGVAEFCLREANSVDAILISGDIATTGAMLDLATAQRFVNDAADDGFLSKEARPTLSASRKDVYLIAGNHDRFKSDFSPVTSNSFDFAFANHLRRQHEIDGVGYWVRRKEGKRIAFVTGDFCLKSYADASSRARAFGQGRVYDATLKNMIDVTFKLKQFDSSVTIVWLIHFAPFNCNNKDIELHDWSKIPLAASAAGVAVTICGHTHREEMHVISDHLILCAGSSGCADSERNSSVHVLNVEIGERVEVWRENFRWDRSAASFKWRSDNRPHRLAA
jgi:predicted phosphodiesterase